MATLCNQLSFLLPARPFSRPGLRTQKHYQIKGWADFSCKAAVYTCLFCLVMLNLAGTFNAAEAKTAEHRDKSQPVLKLQQVHYFFGPTNVYIGKNGIRLENKGNLGFNVVARAPNWDVTIYRQDDKTYFTEDLKSFEETGLVSGFLVGRKARFSDVRMRKSIYMMDGFPVTRLTNPGRTLKYLPLKDYGPQQVERVLYAAYKQTTEGQIVLSYIDTGSGHDFITQRTTEGTRDVLLDTSKIEMVNLPDSFFTVPAGLKKAKAVTEVVSGARTREQDPALSEFLDSGSSHHFGKAENKK